MKLVATRSRYGVDGRGCVEPILRLHRARLHLEFLESVREWQRHAQAVIGVLPDRAIQQVGHTVAIAARHGHHNRWVVPNGIH